MPVALDLITSGRSISAQQALEYGVIDAATEGDLRDETIVFARRFIDENMPATRVRDRQDMVGPSIKGDMFWRDRIDLDKVVSKLKEFEDQYGADFTPSPLLEKLEKQGDRL